MADSTEDDGRGKIYPFLIVFGGCVAIGLTTTIVVLTSYCGTDHRFDEPVRAREIAPGVYAPENAPRGSGPGR